MKVIIIKHNKKDKYKLNKKITYNNVSKVSFLTNLTFIYFKDKRRKLNLNTEEIYSIRCYEMRCYDE